MAKKITAPKAPRTTKSATKAPAEAPAPKVLADSIPSDVSAPVTPHTPQAPVGPAAVVTALAPAPSTELRVASPAPVSPAPVSPAPATEARVRTMDRRDFEAIVRKEAFGLADLRGFRNGSPYKDWMRAEALVRDRLAADGVRVTRSAAMSS